MPLRHGRAANVTVAVAEQFDSAEVLSDAVRQHTRARVVLGPAAPRQVEAALGAPPHTTPVGHVPPGRGYARLGVGAVHRLQVPRTPDPYDDATSDADRQAVLELLPPRRDGSHEAGGGKGAGNRGGGRVARRVQAVCRRGSARPLARYPAARRDAARRRPRAFRIRPASG